MLLSLEGTSFFCEVAGMFVYCGSRGLLIYCLEGTHNMMIIGVIERHTSPRRLHAVKDVVLMRLNYLLLTNE